MLRDYQSRVGTAADQFPVNIALYVGDGVLIYFGWPDVAGGRCRTCRPAGLAVAAAVNETPVRGEDLKVRVGIATGHVVIGALIVPEIRASRRRLVRRRILLRDCNRLPTQVTW